MVLITNSRSDGEKSAIQGVFSIITRLTGMLQMQLDDTISGISRLPLDSV
jgi:hypothetical protein